MIHHTRPHPFHTIIVIAVTLLLTGCHLLHLARLTGNRHAATLPATTQAAEPMSIEAAMALIDSRPAWEDRGPINIPHHPAEKYLKGMTIVLDPGHGGTDGGVQDTRSTYKRGPAGIREADINLRVALLLERLLKDAGVNVTMTRHGDDTIDLRSRAEVANHVKRQGGGEGADLFISIHHNATSSPDTNFTSVWYHNDVDDAEVGLDVARHVSESLAQQTRTQAGLTSPIMSDRLMYNSGFGVLRAAKVPAILCECTFFTNPSEEQRLRDAGYNLREAYGIYLGLCQYAYQGRPTQTIPQVTMDGSQLTIKTTLDEGLPGWWGKDRNRILQSTISATLDGQPMSIEFDPKSKLLTAKIVLKATGGAHLFNLHHANMFKHHNYPQRYAVTLTPGEPGHPPVPKVEILGPNRAAISEELLKPAPSTAPSTQRVPTSAPVSAPSPTTRH